MRKFKNKYFGFVLLLAGYMELIPCFASAGVLNDFYLQILQQIDLNIIWQ